MKKVGIVTSNTSFANNYGAVLQCYALCGQLRKWGLDPYVINYAYKNQGVEITTTTKTKRSVLSRMKYILSQDVSVSQKVQYRLMRDKREKMRRQFLDFCNTHISFHSETPSDFSELEKNPPDYEYFITGSDQVWNPVIHGNRNDKGCFPEQRQTETADHRGHAPGDHPSGGGHHQVPAVFRYHPRPHRPEL